MLDDVSEPDSGAWKYRRRDVVIVFEKDSEVGRDLSGRLRSGLDDVHVTELMVEALDPTENLRRLQDALNMLMLESLYAPTSFAFVGLEGGERYVLALGESLAEGSDLDSKVFVLVGAAPSHFKGGEAAESSLEALQEGNTPDGMVMLSRADRMIACIRAFFDSHDGSPV